jgi:RES domain-containing protein
VRLPDGRVWLRVASPDWSDPLDPSYARANGGRWNGPGSFDCLYLNGDPRTARLQVERMLAGSPATIDDLEDDAYTLVAATLPGGQRCADAVSAEGLRSLGFDDHYPLDSDGDVVGHEDCRTAGARVRAEGLRGVWCRSAASADGSARELAWFPATPRSRARAVWPEPFALGGWREASTWSDLGLPEQADPSV